MNRIVVGVGAVLVIVVVLLLLLLSSARGAIRTAGLAVDSLEAVVDTNRRHVLAARDSAKLLGDSLAIVQRRAIQITQAKDATDRALGLERIAKANLAAQVRRLETTVSSSTPTRDTIIGGETIRTANFQVRQEPYTVAADVSLPAPPARGTLKLDIALDRIPLVVREGCGGKNAQGIRSATWTITGPSWATVAIDRVEQSPELCNPTEKGARKGFLARFGGALRDHAGVGPSYSVVFVDGEIRGAFGASIMFRVWP